MNVGPVCQAVADDAGLSETAEVSEGGIIAVEYGYFGQALIQRLVQHAKEKPLGRHVALDAAVEVQMVGPDIRHGRDVKFAVIEAMLGQSVGRGLDDSPATAGVCDLSQHRLQLWRFGRRESPRVG